MSARIGHQVVGEHLLDNRQPDRAGKGIGRVGMAMHEARPSARPYRPSRGRCQQHAERRVAGGKVPLANVTMSGRASGQWSAARNVPVRPAPYSSPRHRSGGRHAGHRFSLTRAIIMVGRYQGAGRQATHRFHDEARTVSGPSARMASSSAPGAVAGMAVCIVVVGEAGR